MKTAPALMLESAIGAGRSELARLRAMDPQFRELEGRSLIRVAIEVRPFVPHQPHSSRGPVVGYAAFTIDAARVLTIERVFVAVARRRRGVASEIVRKVERKAKVSALRAIVWEDDIDSQLWLNSLGLVATPRGPMVEFERASKFDVGARVLDSILSGDGRPVREDQ